MQRILLRRYKRPLVCFTCNMPGAVKRCEASHIVFRTGLSTLLGAMSREISPPLHMRSFDRPTGSEGYIVSACLDAGALKRLCIRLEDSHPLGRLFDLDVIGLDGAPLSRRKEGLAPRPCLVCNGPAADCVSRQLHPLQDIYEAVASTIEGYKEASLCT